MDFTKIILIAEFDSDMPNVTEFVQWSMKGYTEDAIVINDRMILIDTSLSVDEIKTELNIKDVEVLAITEDNVCEMLGKYGNVEDILVAIKKLELPNNINYYLDLMVERGAAYMLTDKEINKLNELARLID
jgi:hypothetical protein